MLSSSPAAESVADSRTPACFRRLRREALLCSLRQRKVACDDSQAVCEEKTHGN